MTEKIPVKILTVQYISNADPSLCRQLGVPEGLPALGLISTDCDDATYIALDEATKAASVSVAYARSLYGGAGNATMPSAGEVIGILAGPSPAETRSGMAAALSALKTTGFLSAGDTGTVYLSHVVSRTGSFLSKEAEVPEGSPLAYLIAPPVEAMYALDAALKAADVRLKKLYAPPTETNFAGGLLTGTQSACRAACDAFAKTVMEVAQHPRK